MRIRRSCAALMLLLTLATSVPLAAQFPAPTLDRPLAEADETDLAEGRRLYLAQCALCHGIDGSGGYGPSLLSPAFSRAADDAGLFQLVRVGIPGLMPGFGEANGVKRSWQLAAFVRTFTRTAATEPSADAARRGAGSYRTHGCGNCHVLGGLGRAIGPDLTAIGLQRGSAYLRQALVDPAARVPEGHVVVTVRPKNGPPVRGVRASEDAFWIHVRDTAGQLHAFRVAELVELTREAGASLMPTYRSMPEPELADLVAYLSSLRGRR